MAKQRIKYTKTTTKKYRKSKTEKNKKGRRRCKTCQRYL